MRTIPIIGVFIAAVFLGTPAIAADPGPLDLQGALKFALSHSQTILTRRSTLASLEANYARLHAAEFPTIVGSLQNTLQKSANSAGAFQQFNLSQQNVFSQNTAQIGSNWTINTGSSQQLSAQQAKRQQDAAQADLRRSEQQLAVDVSNGFYALVARREATRLARADRAYQQALLDVARQSEKVGRVAGVDVLRAQANELRSESTLVSATSDEANAAETLAQTIGAPAETAFAIPAIVPEPALVQTPLAQLITIAQNSRLDIFSARATLDADRLAEGLIETDRRPIVQLGSSFGNQTSPTTFVSQQRSIDQQNIINRQIGQPLLPSVVRGGPGFWQLNATSTFSLPLVEYGTRRAQHNSARAAIDAAQSQVDATKRNVEIDVRQALRAAQTASATLAFAKQSAQFGAESARVAQLQYKNGLISLTDANAAQQTSLSSQNDLINARIAYVEAAIRLRVALGTYDPLVAVDVK